MLGEWLLGEWLLGEWLAGGWLIGDWLLNERLADDWLVHDWLLHQWLVFDRLAHDWLLHDWRLVLRYGNRRVGPGNGRQLLVVLVGNGWFRLGNLPLVNVRVVNGRIRPGNSRQLLRVRTFSDKHFLSWSRKRRYPSHTLPLRNLPKHRTFKQLHRYQLRPRNIKLIPPTLQPPPPQPPKVRPLRQTHIHILSLSHLPFPIRQRLIVVAPRRHQNFIFISLLQSRRPSALIHGNSLLSDFY